VSIPDTVLQSIFAQSQQLPLEVLGQVSEVAFLPIPHFDDLAKVRNRDNVDSSREDIVQGRAARLQTGLDIQDGSFLDIA
jgi:hypothetical protein